ncbi:MAG: hypothetical protein ACI905_001815 [Roseivirga sp.]
MSNLTQVELQMANELLYNGLQHEGLYTLLDTLKPISSLGFPLSYPIAKASEMKDGDKSVLTLASDSTQMALSELTRWNKVLKNLSNEKLSFHLVPFKNIYQGKRNLQVLVVRRDLFEKKLTQNIKFFGQWGFTPTSDPAIVLTTLEFESRNDRYRAYGYLFGYPDHAVDFFVNASISEEETGLFVTRDFFSMPVAVGRSGHFTYAIPKGYTPTKVDSSIYYSANARLSQYYSIKGKYSASDKTDAVRLISDYWSGKISRQ